MIHHLIKLALEVGGAIVAAATINEGVRYFTGKSALQHLSEAAGPLRDDIVSWCHRNPDKQISSIVLRVVAHVDNALSGLARVKVVAMAKTKEGEVKVTETIMTEAEFMRLSGGKNEITVTV